MKERGKFYVERKYDESSKEQGNTFTAVFEPEDDTALSTLYAEEEGVCDNVKTVEVYRGCGLAKYLLATCFQDWSILGEDGRGVDVINNFGWKKSPMLNNAFKYCKTMVTLICGTNPSRNCISYLRAASSADFDLLFAYLRLGHMNAFKLGETLESEFIQRYDEFIAKNGPFWYFCKCKEGSEQPCLAMESNEP